MTEYKAAFASGEAGTADAAYAIAEKNLWATIADKYPTAVVRSIQHSTATRNVVTTGLNIEEWREEHREVSAVIVTLLAALAIDTREKK